MTYGDGLRQRLRLGRVGPKLRNEARRLAAPIAARRTPLRHEAFAGWDGEPVPYFVHPYNTTWRNERAIEVPLAAAFLRSRTGPGMEFGNVLAHYGLGGGREVVDKYEQAPGVTNVDVVDHVPAEPLDHIVSISTIEHVGWDERPRDAGKVLVALDRLRGMLAPDGVLFVTAPLGHNDTLDEAVIAGLDVRRQLSYVRDGRGWRRTAAPERRPYGTEAGGWAASLWVAELGPA